MLSKKTIMLFQQEILDWYAKNKRDLPWRQTRDPYKILVSEIMLQQTQVPRVIPKYIAWLEAFPTVKQLATAKTSDVLRLWSGLGYNRRALFLQRAAQKIVADFNGTFPQSEKELRLLPGIGEYTSRAVLCFAFDQQVAVVDTNVRKVILLKFLQNHPEFAKQKKDPSGFLANARNDNVLKDIAQLLLPQGKAYEWNQALMDYASAVLVKEKVPLKKQSAFKGSNRYYRGQVLKLLMANGVLHIEELSKKLGKEREELIIIIAGLVKDGMVIKEGLFIHLP